MAPGLRSAPYLMAGKHVAQTGASLPGGLRHHARERRQPPVNVNRTLLR